MKRSTEVQPLDDDLFTASPDDDGCRPKKMVGFGQKLREARREGWEGGYLNYQRLGDILDQMRNLEFDANDLQSSSIQQYDELSNQFTSLLQQEIEKVSTFSLAKIGLSSFVGTVLAKFWYSATAIQNCIERQNQWIYSN